MPRFLVALAFAFAAAASSMAGTVPQVEIQALDRAIKRELADDNLGSQTLGDLQRLKYRLEQMQLQTRSQALAELEPLDTGAAPGDTLSRLEREAEAGGRPALRTLALYHLYQNNPEQSLRAWRRMGEANPNDLAYQLLSSYLELALGEYNAARLHLDTALRLIDSRTGIELSTPVLCDNIAGYRLYVPRQKKTLLPGDDTLLYIEIEGADFHPVADGDFECRLMFGMRLKNESGTTLWAEKDYGEYAPLFNGPIRDLHTALSWRIPNDLQPGIYTLIVEAEEQPSLRRGETTLELTIAKRPTNPDPKLTPDQRIQANKMMQDAGKMFPGATPQFQPQGLDSFSGQQYYDILKNNERLQGGMER